MANGVMIVVHRTPRTIAARRRMELVGEVQDAIINHNSNKLNCSDEDVLNEGIGRLEYLKGELEKLNYSAPLIEKLKEAMK